MIRIIIFLVLAITAFVTSTAKVEERENLCKFGVECAAYMKRTTMFIPFFL